VGGTRVCRVYYINFDWGLRVGNSEVVLIVYQEAFIANENRTLTCGVYELRHEDFPHVLFHLGSFPLVRLNDAMVIAPL
jgi:hypothetical protein